MTQHDDRVYIGHMVDAAQKAVKFSSGRTRRDLETDEILSLALVRLLHIIGEAARQVGVPFRELHPEIPWREIIGTRDRLVHGYDKASHDIVWKILRDELPPLIAVLEPLVPPDEPQQTP